MFKRETPLEKEWKKLKRQETHFLSSRQEKKDSFLNRKLEEKVPDKLQSTLDAAFAKSFFAIFDKGTGVIEKTYQKDKMEQDFKVQQYAMKIRQDAKSLKVFSKKAKGSGTKNLLISGVSGIGMGALGIGIPDIMVFTGMMLRSVYEIALHYGFPYDTKEERYFILLLLQGALSYGIQVEDIDRKLNVYIKDGQIPENYIEREQIKETAGMFSRELLYMKFLQGIPIVGIVGGMYDAVYMKQVTEYSEQKYRRRFLSRK